MTAQTHTQGPWTTYIKGGADGWIAAADGNLIACAIRDENMQSNARLIAAAPDLLAALERLAAQIVESVIYDEARKGQDPQLLADVEAAKIAIAKAKGA